MGNITSAVIAQQGQVQQTIGLSAVKQSAQQGQKLADILEQSAQTVSASTTRGTNVDITA